MNIQQPYCDSALEHPLHRAYHDNEYGFPQTDDTVLFERLVLEINQAGLSWLCILKKRPALQAAYAQFSIDRVASMSDSQIALCLHNPLIVRNQRKILAAVANARVLLQLRQTHGSFYEWLMHWHPLSEADWVRMFKRTFVFTGPQITREFLMSIGLLPGAHHCNCPIYHKIALLDPAWMSVT